MILTSYVSLYKNVVDEETGEVYQELFRNNIKIPIEINSGDILSVTPYVNEYGAVYKHYSTITDRYGNVYRVKGTFKDIINLKNNYKSNYKGYKNG